MSEKEVLDVDLMRSVLSDEGRSSFRRFGKITGVPYQQGWSGVDLIVHGRRLATYEQRSDVVGSIDRGIGALWLEIASRLTEADDATFLDKACVRGLATLTVRFPSAVIHGSFVEAMIAVSNHHRANHSDELNPYARLFTPVWNKTIDRATSESLDLVFVTCRDMFLPGDYFVGYWYAWQFGKEVARRYVASLSKALAATSTRLPLGSKDDLDRLSAVVRSALSSNRSADGFAGQDLLEGMHGPFSAWAEWLGDVAYETKDIRDIYESVLQGDSGAVKHLAEIAFSAESGDPYELIAGI